MRILLASVLCVGLMAREPDAALPRTLAIDGQLTFADYERLIEHAFEVPAGARRIEIALTATGADRRTVIDLGLRDPEGLRGWSGGRTNRISVSRLSATPGYLPGSIPPGRWAVIVGVPNIRRDSRDSYRITITIDAEEAGDTRPSIRAEAGWFVGDLHAHSFHSDGRGRSQSGKAVPVPLHRVLDESARSGLDFVAVSDHNTASHWLDIDRLQPYYDGLLLLHSREVTTYRGHANTVGERSFAEFRLAAPTASPAGVLQPIAGAGAFVSINHPATPDDERCMGCGWNVVDEGMRRAVHGVEVVNGETRDGPTYGWPFWADLMNRGWQVTAVGGSDDHTPDDGADGLVGRPATVVWARELSEAAIVEGLRSGRAYVRTRGPEGPSLELRGRAGNTVVEMGGTMAGSGPVSLVLEATVSRAAGQTLDWIANGRVAASVAIAQETQHFERPTVAAPGDWFSVNVRDADGPTLLGNAVRVTR